MAETENSKLGMFSTLSIGIGGMVGGGIFAVTGLTIEITRGAAPVAFLISGIVALLTSYSYLKLTLRFPGEGGTVEYLNRAFGSGILTGAANILLLMCYIVLVAIYAYAFGSYGASVFPADQNNFWQHTLVSGVIIGLCLLNIVSTELVIRSENFFNGVKMVLLAIFVVAGLLTPMDWTRLGPENYVSPVGLIAGAMLIFLNYEGFELIANASNDVANPKKTLPVAYLGGIFVVMVIYVLIVGVVVGHMSFAEVGKVSDRAIGGGNPHCRHPRLHRNFDCSTSGHQLCHQRDLLRHRPPNVYHCQDRRTANRARTFDSRPAPGRYSDLSFPRITRSELCPPGSDRHDGQCRVPLDLSRRQPRQCPTGKTDKQPRLALWFSGTQHSGGTDCFVHQG